MTAMVEAPAEPGVYQLFPDGLDWEEHEEDIDWEVIPFIMGPTWDRDPGWTGPRDPDGYILPHHTLGYQVVKWVEDNLLADETDEHDNHLPFLLTPEQVRFVLWFYAIDETGRFLYREITLQRLKGHGKDPIAAVIAAVEFVGPCRFAGWSAVDRPDLGIIRGDPVGKGHPRAWIQIAAVTQTQTGNTMKLFRGLFSPACITEHGIDMGKTVIYAYGGMRAIESVTRSPRSLEGNRPTLVIANEPHQWVSSNEGKAMYDSIERNATKAKGAAARVFAITNAYEPSEDSVGRDLREAYLEQVATGTAQGTMYDSLEAPKTARLRPIFPDEAADAREKGIEPIPIAVKDRLTRKYIRRVLEAVRGGAWWLDIPNLTSSILNPKNKASRSRRFWYNQITGKEDAWVNPDAVDAAIDQDIAALRKSVTERILILQAGWEKVTRDDKIVAFFDGSKSDDSTAIVGCRLSDGYCFLIGVWARPDKLSKDETWLAPRGAVDLRVREMFTRFNVVAFWGDPSHAKDQEGQEDETSYWMPYLDKWMREYRDRLDPAYWPVKTGLRKHAINFDMTQADRTKAFIEAAEQTVEDFQTRNDIEEFEPTFSFDGHPVLVQHLKNAVSHYDPRGWGISPSKEQKDSKRKIDCAVCLVGSRMLARVVLNGPEEEEEKPGEIWF